MSTNAAATRYFVDRNVWLHIFLAGLDYVRAVAEAANRTGPAHMGDIPTAEREAVNARVAGRAAARDRRVHAVLLPV